jgi:hypothetical protein
MPFGTDEFFAVFARYNAAVWPAQIVSYAAAIVAVGALFRPSRRATIVIGSILAAMWLVNAIGYHLIFFAPINPAAYLFAVLFSVEAFILAISTIFQPELRFAVSNDRQSILGLALLGFASILYPLWGAIAGRDYPAVPMLGLAPCPTVIFTIGILVLARPKPAGAPAIVPLIWSAIGGSAAVFLEVPQDFGLWIAALILLGLLLTVGGRRTA